MGADPRREDEELVERCLRGDSPAWEALVREKSPLMLEAVRRSLLRSGGAGAAAAEDVVQDTFLLLSERDGAVLRRFQWRCSLDRYLVSVALYRAVAWLREERRGVSLDREAPSGELYRDLLAAGEADAPAACNRDARLDHLSEAMEKLPHRERLLLQLFYWRSLPAETIARMLRTDAGSVRVFLTRARRRLRELMERGRFFLL